MSCRHYVRILGMHKPALREQYKVREIGIFGSYARGEQRLNSDIDVLVDFDEVPDLIAFMGLAEYLERILGKKVDLVRKPVIRKELREEILTEVIYA